MIDLEYLKKNIAELEEDNVLEILNSFVESNPSEDDVQKVLAACQGGMAEVGSRFEANEYFVGDLIFAGELLNSAIEILKPVIGAGSSDKVGAIVLGTVEGDLHDIGKNIFKGMIEAVGFEVYDLGIDQSPEAFVAKVKEVEPEIVGMSGVLTLAIDAMKKTVTALEEAGLRDKVKVIIGGNPVNSETSAHVGADAFTSNAAEGVKICQRWVS